MTKRLLVRFKDKTPAPLNSLDLLMERAQDHVQEAGRAVRRAQRALAAAGDELSGRLLLLLALARVRFALEPAAAEALRAYLLLQQGVRAWDEAAGAEQLGWEEAAEASLAALLRSGMTGGAWPAAPAAAQAPPPAAGPGSAARIPDDAGKLRKLLNSVVDRLAKGSRVIV